MNKTTTINISGFVFNIEEEAYENLKLYLDQIKEKFGNQEERDEIMDDIELRIAELFQEKISAHKEVIIQKDIDETIAILGHPDDFEEDEDVSTASSTNNTNTADNQNEANSKRLYRDKDNAMLGGVCSGISHYFSVDVVLIRIIFLVLFLSFGTGVVLYIILLIITPEAKTTSDKIKMKGQHVNVENIKEFVSSVKQDISSKEKQKKIKTNFKEIVNNGRENLKPVFHVISTIIGTMLTLAGIIWLTILLLVLFGDTGFIPFIGEGRIENVPTLIEIVYPGKNPSSLIFISLILLTAIPIIGIIYIGIKLLTKHKHNHKKIKWTLGITWFISMLVFVFFTIKMGSHFKSEKTIKYPIALENPNAKTLIVDVMNDDQFSNHIDPFNNWNKTELIKVDEQFIYNGLPFLSVKTSSEIGNIQISLLKSSRGSTSRDAILNTEKIDYPIIIKGNKILLSPYIKVPKSNKIRGQYVKIEIVIPTTKSIKFGDNIERIWRSTLNNSFYRNYSNINNNSHWRSFIGKFYNYQDVIVEDNNYYIGSHHYYEAEDGRYLKEDTLVIINDTTDQKETTVEKQ